MGRKRILIVDDQVSVLSLWKHCIERLDAGYQVVTARDGVAALTEFKQRRFDLIVTDYSMPRMNGLELLRLVRLMREDVPVIMVTSHGDAALENEARRLRVYDYLTKSVHVRVFCQTVEAALGGNSLPVTGVN